MRILSNKKNRIILFIVFMLILFIASCILFISYGQAGLLLLLLTVLVSIAGLTLGIIVALGLTLIIFFIMGSMFFWMSLSNQTLFENEIPIIYIFSWMVVVLILSIVTGACSQFIKELHRENKLLKEQIRTLVAIDPITGFDNNDRMLLELDAEFSRAKRYGNTYSFLLIKMNYFDQFQNLYGERELIHLLKHISQKITQYTRKSDLKFRPKKNLFALLLTNTPIEDMEVIINKLNNELNTFQLQNSKYVTLSFEYGYASFEKDQTDYLTVFENAKEQVLLDVS